MKNTTLSELIRWLVKINKLFISVGSVCLFAMMFIDTANIVGIKLSLIVIPAGKTFIEELMTVVVYIGISFVLFERGHIKSEIVKKHFSPRLRFASDVFTYSLLAAISGLISWINLTTAIEYFQLGKTTPADIPVPMGPFILIISLSFLNFAVCSVALLIRECVREKPIAPSGVSKG